MPPHSSTLAWKIPWTKEPGRLQSMGSQRVGHNWVTSLSLFTFMHWRRKWQPTPVFLPGESQGQGSLVGCRLWGCRVGHDWCDLAAAAGIFPYTLNREFMFKVTIKQNLLLINVPEIVCKKDRCCLQGAHDHIFAITIKLQYTVLNIFGANYQFLFSEN